MAESTQYYQLTKPSAEDFVDISVLNSNFDVIDTALQANAEALEGVVSENEYTAADILNKLRTVDGVGSGLDADLFKGNSVIPLANGGTGATTALDARTSLGITPNNIGAVANVRGSLSAEDYNNPNYRYPYVGVVNGTTATAMGLGSGYYSLLYMPHVHSNGYGVQIAWGYTGTDNGKGMWRSANGTTWSDWRRFYTTTDKPTLTEVLESADGIIPVTQGGTGASATGAAISNLLSAAVANSIPDDYAELPDGIAMSVYSTLKKNDPFTNTGNKRVLAMRMTSTTGSNQKTFFVTSVHGAEAGRSYLGYLTATDTITWHKVFGSSDIVPVVNGGTGETTTSGMLKTLCNNTANTAPAFVIGFNSGWQNAGYTSVANLRNAMGLGNSTGVLSLANGGTGATTAADARTNLGAVNKAGDTMTGTLTIKRSLPIIKWQDVVAMQTYPDCGMLIEHRGAGEGGLYNITDETTLNGIRLFQLSPDATETEELRVQYLIRNNNISTGFSFRTYSTGIYTGTNTAETRTVNIPGTGNKFLLIRQIGTGSIALVTNTGAICKSHQTITALGANECSFYQGVLTLATTNPAVNGEGSYGYENL